MSCTPMPILINYLPGMNAPKITQAGGLLRTPRASVMMRMRDRTVALAHHLRPAQAKELVRRLTIRLLD